MDDPKSELDSRSNMIVLGKHCFVFECSVKPCTVNHFNNFLGSVKNVPIINAAIAYDCPYSQKSYILICHNYLYLTNTEDNLLTPFSM